MDILGFLITLLSIILIVALVLVSAYSMFIIHKRNKYSHLPCPQPVSFFLGHASALKKFSDEHGNFEVILSDWRQKYGNTYVLFVLHNVFVITCNPDNVKELLVTGNFPKSERYNQVAKVFGNRVFGRGLATEINHDVWMVRRIGLNPAFNRGVLKELMVEFNTTANELVRYLGIHADKKDTIEIASYLHKATLDVIGRVGFGKDLGSFEAGESGKFSSAIFDMMFIFNESVRDPLLMLPFRGRDYKVRMKKSVDYLREIGKKWMHERRAAIERGDYVPDDILSYLVKLKDHDEILLDDIVTLFIAGQETTANTTSFMLLEMGRHPEILKKMYDEVDEVIGQKPHLTSEDISKLEYLNMVWKETLRLYAVAPVTFRDVNRDDYKIDGYEVPRGSMVMLSSFISSRNPEFVPDPLTFKPERFAPDSPDKPNTYAYFPFSLGPRSCIGQTFALMEGKVLIAKFLQNFKYELDPNQSFKIQESVTLKPQGGVKSTISWRSNTN